MNVESDQRVISGSISRGFNYINYKVILGRGLNGLTITNILFLIELLSSNLNYNSCIHVFKDWI